MIDLYYWPTPNGWKISIALEEMGLPYRVVPVNLGKGEQFAQTFLQISPNNRIPALLDHAPADGGDPVSIFESGAILQQWLMWQIGGLGPMLGQHGHFKLYAPEPIPYAIERYATETRRLYRVLDTQLAQGDAYLLGAYSIADIAIFPWIMTHKAQGLTLDDYPAVKRWYALVRARDAVQRGLAVGRESRQTTMDEEARKNLFGAQRTT